MNDFNNQNPQQPQTIEGQVVQGSQPQYVGTPAQAPAPQCAPPVVQDLSCVPAYAQNGTGVGDVHDLQVGGSSVPRLTLKNNVISAVVDGAVVATFGSTADVAIVGAMPGVGRLWYGKQYDGQSSDLPECWSQDGTEAAPDAHNCPSPDRKCASCPMNVKGSAANGKGKACQYVKNVAVVLKDDPVPGRIYRLSLKGGSIFGPDHPERQEFNFKNFAAYVASLGVQNSAGIVVRIFFDTSPEATPNKLLFQPIGWFEEHFVIEHLLNIPEDLLNDVVSMDFGLAWQAREQAQAEQQAAPAPQPQPQPQPQFQAQQPAPQQATPVQQPAPQPAPVVQPQPAPAPQPQSQPAPAPQQAAPVQQPAPQQAAPAPAPQPQPQPVQQPAPQPEPQSAPAAQQEAQPAEQPAQSAEALQAALEQFKVKL